MNGMRVFFYPSIHIYFYFSFLFLFFLSPYLPFCQSQSIDRLGSGKIGFPAFLWFRLFFIHSSHVAVRMDIRPSFRCVTDVCDPEHSGEVGSHNRTENKSTPLSWNHGRPKRLINERTCGIVKSYADSR